MATTTRKPKSTMLADVNGMVSGLTAKPPANAKNVNVLNEVFTVPTLITALVAVQQVLQAAVTTRSAYKTAVVNAKAEKKAQRAFVSSVRTALVYLYGADLEGLQGCGISPPKARTPLSSDARSIAKAKAAATRAANGTGKKPPKPSPTVTVTDANGQVIGRAAASSTPPPALGR